MAVSNLLFDEPNDIVPDYSDTGDNEQSPSDQHPALLAAANSSIERTLSRDPMTFLNRHKQAGGE
jgi:hypothetical protein